MGYYPCFPVNKIFKTRFLRAKLSIFDFEKKKEKSGKIHANTSSIDSNVALPFSV
ncbi:hypothetical protein AT05_01760 [Schleiferia thermophila str. Yellowstone]|jgi:hypothetical protein|nr:hypothetical protein AT05_01760 [Schleiferia thermophila str. Yellowstone]